MRPAFPPAARIRPGPPGGGEHHGGDRLTHLTHSTPRRRCPTRRHNARPVAPGSLAAHGKATRRRVRRVFGAVFSGAVGGRRLSEGTAAIHARFPDRLVLTAIPNHRPAAYRTQAGIRRFNRLQ
jgi:hypothetical protein